MRTRLNRMIYAIDRDFRLHLFALAETPLVPFRKSVGWCSVDHKKGKIILYGDPFDHQFGITQIDTVLEVLKAGGLPENLKGLMIIFWPNSMIQEWKVLNMHEILERRKINGKRKRA